MARQSASHGRSPLHSGDPGRRLLHFSKLFQAKTKAKLSIIATASQIAKNK
jgi:hypothetical protein